MPPSTRTASASHRAYLGADMAWSLLWRARFRAGGDSLDLGTRDSLKDGRSAWPGRRLPGEEEAVARFTRTSLVIAGAIMLAGASVPPAWGQTQPAATVRVDGSTGVAPLISALVKAYSERNPAVSFEIGRGMGTSARIDALGSGAIDIAMASHGLRPEELTRRGMAVAEIARTAVVFAVNAGVTGVAGLTGEQVCAVYRGERGNWRELGGPDLPIVAMTRPDSEVDAEVVREGVACLRALRMAEGVRVMARAGDMAAGLAGTAGAIGMTTSTVTEQSVGRVRALALDGVVPDAPAVRDGRYRLVREAYLVTRGEPDRAVAGFLAFVRGPDGAAVIAANGAVPVEGR